MPKRPREVLTDALDTGDVDDFQASKVRRIYDQVGDQLKRIRRKSEQDDGGNLVEGCSPHSKNICDNFKGQTRSKSSIAETFHDILKQIFDVKTKTMEQHANFFIQRECEMLDNESNISGTENRHSLALSIKQEPKTPAKKSVIVFGKGSSMYNPIVIFDGKSVDLEGDGVEVVDTLDENIEIIDLDDSTDNIADYVKSRESMDRQQNRRNAKEIFDVRDKLHKSGAHKPNVTKELNPARNSVLLQSHKATKEPILSVTVTGKTRHVTTSLPLSNTGTSNEAPNSLDGPSRIFLHDDRGPSKVQNTNGDFEHRQNDSSKNKHVSVGIELNTEITKINSGKSGRRHSKSTSKEMRKHENERGREELSSCKILKDVTNMSVQPTLSQRSIEPADKKTLTKDWKLQGTDSSETINQVNMAKESNKETTNQIDKVFTKLKVEKACTDNQNGNISNISFNNRSRSRGKSRKRNKKKQNSKHKENFYRGHNAFIDDRTKGFQEQHRQYMFHEPYRYRNTRPVMSDDWYWRRQHQHRPFPHWKDRFYTRHQIEISWYPIKCDVCHAHFRSRYEFLHHVSRFAHCPFDDFRPGKVALYVCSYCPFETKFLFKIMQHYCNVHGSYFRYHGYDLVMMQSLCRS